MINAVTDLTVTDHLLCQRDCRHAAIIETNQVGDTGPSRRVRHPTSFRDVSRQGFFTNNCLPTTGGCERNFGMRVVRRAYVNDVDRRICHDRFPIIDGGFPI